MTTAVASLSTTQYVKVNTVRKTVVLQSKRDSVRIVLAGAEPILANDVYHTLGGDDAPLVLSNIETDVWALAITDNSQLVITELDNTTQPHDYLTSVKLGEVPGVSVDSVVARNPAIGTSFEDLWGAGGMLTYPTSAETWEVLSSSANDSAAGSGVRSLSISSIDANGDLQTQVVVLNGTTPVALTGTHLRPAGMTAISAGATECNEGTITLRSTSTQDARNVMLPMLGRSQDTHFTVPAGKQALVISAQVISPKDGSGSFQAQLRPFGTDTSWITTFRLNTYQNSISFPVESRRAFPPRSDVRLQVKADTGEIDVTVIFEYLLVDL